MARIRAITDPVLAVATRHAPGRGKPSRSGGGTSSVADLEFRGCDYSFVERGWEDDVCANRKRSRWPIDDSQRADAFQYDGGCDAVVFNASRKQSRVRLFESRALFRIARLRKLAGRADALAKRSRSSGGMPPRRRFSISRRS